MNPYSLVGIAVIGSLLVGCGGSPMTQVGGKVLYKDGTPIDAGIRYINFQAKEDSDAEFKRTATSALAKDGSFQLSTKRRGDGVYKGQYWVTITAITDSVTGKSLIPEKYGLLNETPLECDVSGKRDDLLFEIDRLGEETEDE